jgi:hypothetical protein
MLTVLEVAVMVDFMVHADGVGGGGDGRLQGAC